MFRVKRFFRFDERTENRRCENLMLRFIFLVVLLFGLIFSASASMAQSAFSEDERRLREYQREFYSLGQKLKVVLQSTSSPGAKQELAIDLASDFIEKATSGYALCMSGTARLRDMEQETGHRVFCTQFLDMAFKASLSVSIMTPGFMFEAIMRP